MQKNSINKAELKSVLPYGAVKEIAKRSKKSIYTVSRVLNKGGKSPLVLKALKEYLEENRQLNMEINQLVSEAKA